MANVYALTTSDVAAVSVAGTTPIQTAANSTLPNGLRAVAIELRGVPIQLAGHEGQSQSSFAPCPPLTPLDANGSPIRRLGKTGTPLLSRLPLKQWEAPRLPPSGVCRLTAIRLPPRIVPDHGTVALQVRRFSQLPGRAFLACTDTTFIYREENHLRAAVLLDASSPAATPPPLPAIRPVAGHPGIFAAPGSQGETVARRIRGAWLVVEEVDGIGLHVPVELLEHLRATVHL